MPLQPSFSNAANASSTRPRSAPWCTHVHSRTCLESAYCRMAARSKSGARPGDVGVRPRLDARFRLLIPRRDRGFGRGQRVGGDAVARAEIDVFLGHLEREDGLAGLAVVNVAVPPRESDLARLDPRHVFDHGRLVQTVDRFRFQQRAGTVSDQHDAPRGLHRQRAHDLRSVRPGCELANQFVAGSLARRPHERHPGVMAQGGLGDRRIGAVRPGKRQRHIQQRAPPDVAIASGDDVVLVRRPVVFEVLHEGGGLARQPERGGLVGDGDRSSCRAARQLVAQGEGIVVTAENHIRAAVLRCFQRVAGFMEAIVRMVRLPEQNRHALVHGSAALAQNPAPRPSNRPRPRFAVPSRTRSASAFHETWPTSVVSRPSRGRASEPTLAASHRASSEGSPCRPARRRRSQPTANRPRPSGKLPF